MPLDTYQDTVDWLFQQFPSYQRIGGSAYKPGLQNTRDLCALYGNPENNLKFVHVAGSNGKGSTSSMLASVLTESKLKVGLFTSPHLLDFSERIRINGEPIHQEFVIDFCQDLQKHTLSFAPSFFEITWVMALKYFEAKGVDICVIETGLGGRLDSTNVVHPLISIITNISLEHTQFLGYDLPTIAMEKAGIIKQSVPVIIGERQLETIPVFEAKAKEMKAPIYFAQDISFAENLQLPLLGVFQVNNWLCVQKALELLSKHFLGIDELSIQSGLTNLIQNTGFQARLQIVSENPRVIFDVSHNADGIEKTLTVFKDEIAKKELKIVYGSSSDKNFDEIFRLFPSSIDYFFTEFANERSAKLTVLKENSEKNKLSGKYFSKPKEALNEAKTLSFKHDTILVFGSFFLIHDFLK
jgi:dihydrofolate synthase/folylpolyglutamate synthase